MATYVKLNEEVEGPFSDEEIKSQFDEGRFTLDTPAWKEGMKSWKTVGHYFTDLVARA